MAYQSSEGISVARAEVESTTGTGSTQALTVTDGSSTKFVVQEDGRVGIGTATPGATYKLDVSGDIHTDAILRMSRAGNFSLYPGSSNIVYQLEQAGSHLFKTDGSIVAQIDSSANLNVNLGNLVFGTSGKGIDFGSVAGGSGTPITNGGLLDDYEAGTHTTTATPSSSGSITLNSTSDTLSYTKIGRKVTVTGALGVSAVSSPVGNYVNISLPFQIGDLDELSGHLAGSCVVLNAAGSMGSYSIIGLDGDSSFRIYKNTSSSATATATDFSGDETIYATVTYFTTA